MTLHVFLSQVLGSCFLGLIQTHAKLLSTAAQALAPLAELEADTLINAHPVIPLNAALVQDLTLNWLSSAQVRALSLSHVGESVN